MDPTNNSEPYLDVNAEDTPTNQHCEANSPQSDETSETPSDSTTLPSTEKPTPKQKRLQAQKACSNCKRLHARCDNERPCKRCIQNGLANTCIDLPRKRRMSRSYTEAVNKVWEARYGNQKMPPSTPVSMPTTPAWNVPLSYSPAPMYGRDPMQTPSPTLLGMNSPALPNEIPMHSHSQAFPNSNIYLSEIVNPVAVEVIAPNPTPMLEKDPLMESFLYHQMTELRENVAQNERKYDIDNIRERALQPVWHSFLPQEFAISVWKATNTPGFNYLIECNQRFVELVGFPIEQLRNSFSGQKLFVSKSFFTQKDWPKRTQIATAYGFKEVYITLFPMTADVASNKYFIINMIEVPPAREPVSVNMVPDITYAPELLKQHLDLQMHAHYKL